MAMPGMMADFLATKYAILQQQADAASTQANTGQFNALTNRTVGNAAAALDTTRAGLMPAESEASIAKMASETGLNKETAKYLGPETLARIAKMKAETGFIGTQDAVEKRMGLMERTIGAGSLSSIMAGRMPSLDAFSY